MILRLAVSFWLVCAALPVAAQERWLSVTGSGIARAERMVAVLQVSVAVPDVNARPAMEEAGRVLDRLTSRMRAIPQVDAVATGPVSVVSTRDRPPVAGRQGAYLARGSLTVIISDLDAVPDVTKRLLGGGAQAIEAVAHRAVDPEGLARTALEHAVDDARRKAGGMAAAAGARLGPVLELSGHEVRQLGPADGARYTAGAVTLQAGVTVVFTLGP